MVIESCQQIYFITALGHQSPPPPNNNMNRDTEEPVTSECPGTASVPPWSNPGNSTWCSKPRTSSSLQALPPPVDELLRLLVMPYSWRSITSDVGAYIAVDIVIAMVGDMML